MRLAAHLWAGAPPPPIYILYRFSKEFGWTPDEVRSLSKEDFIAYAMCMSMEAKVAAKRAEAKRR